VPSHLLVVLAIDLPQMTSAFLLGLLSRCSSHCGIVARRGDFFEPLAAIYPRALGSLASTHLAQGRYTMQDFVREAIRQGMLEAFTLDEKDAPLFQNLNTPSDIAELLPYGKGD
jgi:molybdopterin-guanine dinucleotide biosynthesis protein A